MNKVRKSLICPKYQASGNDIKISIVDNFKKYEYENIIGSDIKRTYKCYCKKCMESYEVEYGNAKLRKYNPPISGDCLGDINEYVSYESEFDRSYKIVTVMGTSMIITDDDIYPIIICEETKSLILNTWMNRYR